ncbi:MAG: heme-binding protein [Tabrizicola sp.]|uniref:SOUL family heme-binding protein n=1 Tax=Tabrizicola sp. TaxID=2005166 RepID=UPI002AB9DE18|nr:heme-binding protein [Tabrizicola sp.]MDZ4087869.1 heme-binding protein [Tabrizicola sp.]
MTIEEPKFSLALKDGALEIRDHVAAIAAEVTVKGTQAEASRQGFRLLAGYIFGANSRRQKNAMTAPVTKSAAGEKIAVTAPVTQIPGNSDWLVRFTMPGQYRLADLPVPNDPAVKIRAMVPARFAVLRFSGLAGEAKVAKTREQLLSILRVRGLHPAGPVSIARYNPPWTPWFLRRNEVMISMAGG